MINSDLYQGSSHSSPQRTLSNLQGRVVGALTSSGGQYSVPGPGVSYSFPHPATSPPLSMPSSSYYQLPAGCTMLPIDIQQPSLFLPHSQTSTGIVGHGPLMTRPYMPMEYAQVPAHGSNPGMQSYPATRTRSQSDSPMAGVQIHHSPVPSS